MGQKIHPIGFRLSVKRNWTSVWYADNKQFPSLLNQDIQARALMRKKLKNASVSKIVIERTYKSAKATIYSSKPGLVIGKKGSDIDSIRLSLSELLHVPVNVDIEEVKKPELDAQLVADSIAQQLEKRVMFRRAMKRVMQNAMRSGALGIKVMSSGRLNGVDIARREWYREGRVPLHTLRANVDYALSEALTTYGIIGVKVWVYKDQKLGVVGGAQGREHRSIGLPSMPEKDGIKKDVTKKEVTKKIVARKEGTKPVNQTRKRRIADVATGA